MIFAWVMVVLLYFCVISSKIFCVCDILQKYYVGLIIWIIFTFPYCRKHTKIYTFLVIFPSRLSNHHLKYKTAQMATLVIIDRFCLKIGSVFVLLYWVWKRNSVIVSPILWKRTFLHLNFWKNLFHVIIFIKWYALCSNLTGAIHCVWIVYNYEYIE